MATILLIVTGAYFIFSGALLIALLRSAARTSADWNASTLFVNVPLTDAHSDSGRAHGHTAVGAAPHSRSSTSARHPSYPPHDRVDLIDR
jgi:hypothetical protein